MTEHASPPVGARGAVDLSGLGPTPSTGAGSLVRPSAGAATAPGGVGSPLHLEATDDTFGEIISRHIGVAGLLVLWTSQHPQTRAYLDDVEAVVAGFGGRVVLVSGDLGANPGLLQVVAPLMTQAFGQPSVPATFGLLQGQPVPLFPGVQSREGITRAVEQLLEAAVRSGITGRVDVGEPVETELPPLHQKAFDAIEEGDLDGAEGAYREALAANPKDLDLLGGHVEDAFARLLDLVRSTDGPERDRVRARLLELFSVVGNHDERVRRGRTSLMNALF